MECWSFPQHFSRKGRKLMDRNVPINFADILGAYIHVPILQYKS